VPKKQSATKPSSSVAGKRVNSTAKKQQPKKKTGPTPVAQNRLESIGIDAVCAMIGDGQSITSIAESVGTTFGVLQAWLNNNPDYSARAREVRIATARYWDEKAESVIKDSSDNLTFSQARELAHHYRWRAAKIAPKEYGDKITQEITGKDGAPLLDPASVRGMSPDELSALKSLLVKAGK
jgi:hypothetical protein